MNVAYVGFRDAVSQNELWWHRWLSPIFFPWMWHGNFNTCELPVMGRAHFPPDPDTPTRCISSTIRHRVHSTYIDTRQVRVVSAPVSSNSPRHRRVSPSDCVLPAELPEWERIFAVSTQTLLTLAPGADPEK